MVFVIRPAGRRLSFSLLFLLLAFSQSHRSTAPIMAIAQDTLEDPQGTLDDQMRGGGGDFVPSPSVLPNRNIAQTVITKYQKLPPKGKLIAGAVTGFIGSRLLIGSAIGAIKVAGGAFIVSEILHYFGVMDDIKSLANEQRDFLQTVKVQVLQQAERFRVQVRRRLNPSSAQKWAENDKMGALGLAGGALLATAF